MQMEDGSSGGLLFIDVDAKPLLPFIPTIKEERASSPDETLSKVKKDKNEKVKCTECPNYSCYSSEKLIRHVRRKHLGQKPFQCSMCDYSTTNSVMFEEHVNIHQGIKPYQCKHCPYRSVSRKYLKFHETKHGVCDKCGFVAKNRRELQKHSNSTGCCSDKTDEEHECEPCKQKFHSKWLLRIHKKGHKTCPYCPESLCRSALPTHIFNAHGIVKTPQVKKRFECAQCEWRSNSNPKILLHMIHHPKQVLDGKIDVTPLIEAGILDSGTHEG